MPMDNVALENTQQSISSRDAKSVASVMVNGKWVNLSDTLEQANVKSDVGTVSKQVAEQQTVITSAVAQADSAVAYANDAIEKSRVNSQAIVDINSAVSDAVSDAAVARSDGLRAWNAAQSNADLIDLNYASASAAISSARTEAIAAADEAKASASAAQADIVAVRSDVAAVQADVTATRSDVAVAKNDIAKAKSDATAGINAVRSDVAVAKSDIADTKTSLTSQAKSLSSYAAQASAAGKDITTLKSQAGQLEQDMADTKGDVSQLKVSASSASVALSDAAGNISSLQATAKSYSAALSDTNSNVASVTATASELEAKYADAAGDISQIKTDAKGTAETIADAQGDIASLKKRADGFDTQFTNAKSDIAVIQSDATGTKETLANTKSDVAVLQSRADGFDAKYSDVAGDVSTLQVNAKGMTQTISDAQGDIAKLKTRADGFDTEFASTNGDISKLQTDATGTKQTLTNAKSDIAVLQSRADGFDTKYANAAGDINTLKVDASGMKQTLTDTKGDISTLQATATGFKNTLTDAQGNISTLQSDVSGLKKTTSDHAGNIATLQSDAKTLTSQMSSAQGDISTLKQTASGFSSKVSGMETSLADANNRLNNLKVGTSNLLHHSDTFDGWAKGASVSVTADKYLGGSVAMFNSPGSGVNALNIDLDGPYDNQPVTWTVYAKADNAGDKLHTELWGGGGFTNQALSTEWQIYQFTGQRDARGRGFYLWGCEGNKGNIYVALPFAVVGNMIGTWEPNSTDIADKITTNTTAIEQNKKAITLKADQTVVDKTNGTVQQLQSQLKVQGDQINAKVSSSDLPKLVGNGGKNMLLGTSDDWVTKTASGWMNVTTANDTKTSVADFHSGDKFTYSAVMTNKSDTNVRLEMFCCDNNGTRMNGDSNHALSDAVAPNAIAQKVSCTITIDANTRFVEHILIADGGTSTSKTVQIKDEMFETGIVAHDWQPSLADTQTYTQTQIKQTADSWNANLTSVENGLTDKYTNLHATVDGIQAQVFDKNGSSRITQLSNLIATKVSSSDFDNLSKSVNLQTLDSADINNMKTNGHYFVHNLANNPIGGWVYVDVTGNGNDRIRQDVYQDTGNQHCYRRWYGNYWTAWSQGATESEIIQLSDDINIRVKKGDVVSQINQEAGGNTLIQVSNGKGKLALNASSVVFSGSAFIPDAYISTLNADKLRFYDDAGNVATMSAGLKQYDDDTTKRSIVLQYAGGYEVHASNLLGSILTMHDNNIRLAVKANGMASSGSNDQYSGVYMMEHYTQLSNYRSDGQAPGIYITDDSFEIRGDSTGSGTKWGDLKIMSPQIYVTGGNSVSLSGSNAVQMQAGNVHAWLSNDGILNLYKDNDGGSTTATKLQVNGWAWVRGWVEAAGHSQHSALSTKTDIQPVDDDKMLEMINDTDLATFLYKTDVASGETHRHIGLIIDDVHDVAQYQTPQDFIAPNGVSRDDDNMIGALFGAVKALTKRIKTLESKVG